MCDLDMHEGPAYYTMPLAGLASAVVAIAKLVTARTRWGMPRSPVPWLLTLALLIAAACGRQGLLTLNRAALRASQPRTLAMALTETPAFSAETSQGRAVASLFGLAGWAIHDSVSQSSGQEMARRDGIDDPAVTIRGALAGALARRYSLEVERPRIWLLAEASAQDVAAHYPDWDLVLEVRTSRWGFHPTSIGHYGVSYDGSMRLIDTRARAVLAEGICTSHPLGDDSAPSYDQLVANEGALVRSLVAGVTEFCLHDYRTRILGLY
jgi:hypothetical protein